MHNPMSWYFQFITGVRLWKHLFRPFSPSSLLIFKTFYTITKTNSVLKVLLKSLLYFGSTTILLLSVHSLSAKCRSLLEVLSVCVWERRVKGKRKTSTKMKGSSIYSSSFPLKFQKVWNSGNDLSFICGELGSRPGCCLTYSVSQITSLSHYSCMYSFTIYWAFVVSDIADIIENKTAQLLPLGCLCYEDSDWGGGVAVEVVRNFWLCDTFWG